jgi:hypothetical protein
LATGFRNTNRSLWVQQIVRQGGTTHVAGWLLVATAWPTPYHIAGRRISNPLTLMTRTIRIGNGAGFWGDNLDAPVLLAEQGRLDYLTLEYLAELTMSILAHQRERDAEAGFAGDFTGVLARLCPVLAAQPELRIVTNAGGVNPEGCARAAARVLAAAGLEHTPIGIVTGDDITLRLEPLLRAGQRFANLDRPDEPTLEPYLPRVVAAHAYGGAPPIVAALEQGARLVITGRIADASLTIGPALHEFRWASTDWDRIAGAAVAGHLLECGAQATGGLWCRWRDCDGLADVGYPIAELSDDGSFTITKPPNSGGAVNRETVIEQLVYEIGDPRHYLTPDVDADFTSVTIRETGPHGVHVTGARGGPAPRHYKVSLAYRDGYMASGTLVVFGPDAADKARACGEILLHRVARAGYTFGAENRRIECLGTGASVPGWRLGPPQPHEVVLRVAVWDPRREAVARFCREFAPLVTAGPPGITGYAGERPHPRPVLAYWPTTIPRDLVPWAVHVAPAEEYLPPAG